MKNNKVTNVDCFVEKKRETNNGIQEWTEEGHKAFYDTLLAVRIQSRKSGPKINP